RSGGPPPTSTGCQRSSRFLSVFRRQRDHRSWTRPFAKILLRCGLERGFAQTMDLTVALQNKTAPVECAQRRAVPDRHDGGTLEACVEKAIEHGFRRLIERSRRLVQEKVVWRLQDGAGNS